MSAQTRRAASRTSKMEKTLGALYNSVSKLYPESARRSPQYNGILWTDILDANISVHFQSSTDAESDQRNYFFIHIEADWYKDGPRSFRMPYDSTSREILRMVNINI
jgi:hypothetical protein